MAEISETREPNAVKRILCLANSRKPGGRCIAGREIVGNQAGAWIRPVSAGEHQAVSEQERHYEDGSDPSVLDVIDAALVEARPHHYQQENWLLDPNFYWCKAGRRDWAGLQGFLDPAGPLWVNHQSSRSGLNDRVALSQAEGLDSSLRLIRVDELVIQVLRPGADFGNPKRRVQGQFEHLGSQYCVWVTDPIYEHRYLALPDGRHQLGEACLTISLGEPHEGYAYKLIAAVIERAHTEKQ